jgi:outer membrane assembly lipoprotein YfiO
MMPGRGIWIFALSMALTGVVSAEPHVSELTGQGWQDVARPTSRPTSDPALDRAEQLLGHHQYNAAKKIALNWVLEHKESPLRDRGLFLVAEAFFQYGDRIKSFYYLDELMDEYPESPLFYRALEKQYQIADDYLNGYKRRFLLIPLFSAEDEAIEMLYRIQQRSPGSPLAEKSLLRTADYYYSIGDYELAADAYAAYGRNYPRSPVLPQTKLRQAFSAYAQFRGLRFDPTELVNARSQLVDMIQSYPDLAARDNLPTIIARIDQTLADKIYVTAEFYRRTNQLKGAVWNYRYLIGTFPNEPAAENARKRLAKMPAWALEGLQPQPGEGYLPSTQPSH